MEYSRDNIDRELSLPPLLDEFCKTLKDEIEVAKRNSSNSAIPLSNGHKVLQVGAGFQYAFLVDSVLNIPDGAPGDLMVPGRPSFEASIVSSEGLRLVLSVAVDLGQYVPEARLQSNLTILMRKLIERIELNAASENSAAQRMLGDAPVSGKPKQIANRPDLNNDQFDALQSALGRNLTFIWGPPGTGKTRTIGTITEQLYRENRSVLIVSHTNTAVDQAVKHVAKAISKSEIARGILLRLGEPRDKQLVSDFLDVLLKTQVERRSKEFVEKREQLEAERQALSEQLNPIENDIAILEWVISAKTDIDVVQKRLKILKNKESELDGLERKLSSLSEKRSELIRLKGLSQQAIAFQETLREQERILAELRHQIEQLTTHSSTLARQVRDQENRVEIARYISLPRMELSQYPPTDEQNRNMASLEENLGSLRKNLVIKQTELAAAQTLLDQAKNTGAMMRLWKRLSNPEAQQAVVNRINREVADIQAEILSHDKRLQVSLATLKRTIELRNLLSSHQNIGDYFSELEKLKELSNKLEDSKKKLNPLSSRLSSQEKENQEFQRRIRAYISQLGESPKVTLTRTSEKLVQIDTLSAQTKAVQIDAMSIRRELTSFLVHMVECLSAWGLLPEKPSGVERMFQAVVEVHSNTAAKYRGVSLTELQQKASSIRSVISDISAQVSRIDQELSQVEKTVIAEAAIIGATLTKAYLSDDIQSRKFDTVILDEASMAPIPALWVAALLADKNLVIVGDFLQLPPIVLSKNELTKKWLGRDIFEASGIRAKWETGQPPPYFVPLTEQLRMLPQIMDIANIFYGGQLKLPKAPPDNVQQEREMWQQWYNTEWPHDSPVLLVDTGSLNAWVTSVVKNGNTSRLNFLSATVSIDLAEQLLHPDRPQRKEGDPNRILVVSPYRAHAKLVSVLLRENKTIQDDVIAGTAHSFQGSEAHVVIFDLVADEPHFRVNLFIPDLDDQLKGLLNVSLTRAKYRLIIIGDLEYCQSHAKKAFLGKVLLPFLLKIKKYPRVDALSLVPNGLAARAAKAQMTMLGGAIEPDSDRIVVTQADFFHVLSADFERATNRIVIYSPFMTQDRVSFLLPQLQAAAGRGINIYVVTKAHSERSRADLQQYRKLESLLSDIGAVVIHKLRMHEKLVFVDGDITWSGSLNPLSFSNTREIMERRKSCSVLEDYFKILRLEELVSIHDKPEAKCPICGCEMIAAEGADEPYYWRCVNDECYSRSIDQPYPVDGVFTCANPKCNNAPFEFGYWGDYPHWRCSANTRHRQKIFRSHLRLPKMAALIPKSERKKVCKLLNIDSQDIFDIGNVSETRKRPASVQVSLFDDKT